MTPEALASLIRARAEDQPGRFLTALAGPPGSGKSTMAATVVQALGPGARAVPMDGFHLDDRVLEARGLRSRKGSPETFDAAGFLALVHRLRDEEGEVAIPIFDRAMELSRAAADIVLQEDRFLVIEGNYLLLNRSPWADLRGLFDLTVMIDVPEAELDRRLLARWAHHGKTPAEARAWIDGNDLPNIRCVQRESGRADISLRWDA
ncbi:nucleoside triphosphate hydrolase [Neogemmobacter tilapiae]|uniref:Nucleoside triphosphate hydrolase n=1 Tax=Neogemmobacter tilapiae TaxID=875041 RepID=A0A918TFX3_9RHOB|nr:nucleoside triphosphate hydrolase [Gemmobacter tilapiae]GHC47446.1 nucleoside triphosphate hydrolase [Gemmobacter tilapiae]